MTRGATPFDLVIFDLDGTLVDSLPDIAWALNATLASVGLPRFSRDAVARFVGDGAAKLIERALSDAAASKSLDASSAVTPPPDAPSLLARFMETYAGRVCVDSRLYPGISSLLNQLTGLGVALAVVTNKPGALARALLGSLGISSCFNAIVGDLDGYPRKPDPTGALSIMKSTGATPSRTALLGDGIPDMRLARALSCTAIAALWGYATGEQLMKEEPDLVASTPEAAALLLAGPLHQ